MKYNGCDCSPSYLSRWTGNLASGLLCCLAFYAVCFSAASQANSLADIYELALHQDAQFQASKAAFKADKEVRYQAKAALLPELTVFAGSSFVNNDVTSDDTISSFNSSESQINDYRATLSQPIFNMQAYYGYKQVQAIAKQGELRFLKEQHNLILRSAQLYLNTLRALDQYQSLQAERTAIKEQLHQVQQSYEVGLSSITDVYDAQTSLDLLQARILEAKANISIAVEQLNALTGVRHNQLARVSETMPIADSQLKGVDDWLALAKQHSVSLKEAKQRQRAAQYNHKVKRAASYPTLKANWTLSRSHSDTKRPPNMFNDNMASDSSSISENNAISLDFKLPLYAGGKTSSERRQAYYLSEKEKYNLQHSERELIQEIRSRFLLINTNIAQIKAYKQSIKSSESALKSTMAGYKSGIRNLVDVLVSQRNLHQVRRSYANARYDYLLNTLQLSYTAGTLSSKDIAGIDRWLDKTQMAQIYSKS